MSDEIYVLVDDDGGGGGELQLFAGRSRISSEKLGELLEDFTSRLAKALSKIEHAAGDFELDEVTLNASLSGEYGFTLVAKVGAEAGVSLKFKRRN